MGWSSPKSWVTGYKVLASDLNTFLSDNDAALRAGGVAIASQAAGDVVYASSSTQLARLAADSGKFLKSGSSSVSWDTVAFSGLSPLTTRGDVLISTSGTVTGTRLAVGASGRVLTSDGTDVSWGVASNPIINEGRLTLTSGLAVTTADVTGAGTVYFTLDRGENISLYTGSAWEVVTFAEMSLALSSGTASKPNDIYLDYNGGSPVLTILAWTNDTTRATALARQDGVWVKTGDTQQRYLGTLWLDSSSQCTDALSTRHCWNLDNQRPRAMERFDTTDSWVYTNSSYQQANGSALNQLDVVSGLTSPVLAWLGAISISTGAGRWRRNAIGVDGTSAFGRTGRTTPPAGEAGMATAMVSERLLGRHYLTWLEASSGADTTTWYGDNGSADSQSGLTGLVFA